MKNQFKKLLNFNETCELLNIKPTHLRSLVFKNEIPYLKVGRLLRFDYLELQAWLDFKKQSTKEDGSM